MTAKRFATIIFGGAALVALALLPAGETTGSAQRTGPTLHEQAKRAGGKASVVFEPEPQSFSPDLGSLTRRSDVVVVGRPLSNRGTLSPDGRSVTQDYRVRVQGVVKGGLAPGTTIVVSLPGGGYKFPDGSFVSARAKDYRQAENGKLYVFFLDAEGGGYRLAGGTQGLFRLAEDGKVEPASTSRHDGLAAYKGAGAAAFLKELRAAAAARR